MLNNILYCRFTLPEGSPLCGPFPFLEGSHVSLIKPSHKGLLHKRMGVKQGDKIPKGRIRSDLAKAKRSGNVKDERQDEFALNMGGKGKRDTRPKGEQHPRNHDEFHRMGNDFED